MFDLIVKISPEQNAFLAAVKGAMEAYFGADARRIEHALQVHGYARELLAYVEADPVVTLASAFLHDIGIPEAERRHGSSAGNWQEIEGPPIAAAILAELGCEPELSDRVTAIVGKHHTSGGVDAPEFRILWDADALVNFAGVLPGLPAERAEALLDDHMVTEAGYRLARRMFLAETGAGRSGGLA